MSATATTRVCPCGAPIAYNGKGRPAKLCVDCTAQRYRDYSREYERNRRAREAPRQPCAAGCGALLDLRVLRFGKDKCGPCRAAEAEAARTARVQAALAAEAERREAKARTRGTCARCGTRLRVPVPTGLCGFCDPDWQAPS